MALLNQSGLGWCKEPLSIYILSSGTLIHHDSSSNPFKPLPSMLPCVCHPSRWGPRQERPGGGVAHCGQPSPQASLPATGYSWRPGTTPAPPAWWPVRLVGLPVRQVPGAAAVLAGKGDPKDHCQTGLQAPHHWVRTPHCILPTGFCSVVGVVRRRWTGRCDLRAVSKCKHHFFKSIQA